MSIGKGKRFKVFNRDKFTCQYCGMSAPHVVLHVDHIKPKALGGSDDLANLITACLACNVGKSDHVVASQFRRAEQMVSLGWCSDSCPRCPVEPVFSLPYACYYQPSGSRLSIRLDYACERDHRWSIGMPLQGAREHAQATRDEYKREKGKIRLFPKIPIANLVPQIARTPAEHQSWSW